MLGSEIAFVQICVHICEYIPNNTSVFYTLLHAVLPLLMLQINRSGITFIYTVRLEGDGWDDDEVRRL